MVEIVCHTVTRWRSMQAAAASRCQRGSTTMVAPTYIGPFRLPLMPVTWNIGSAVRYTASCVRPNQFTPPTEVVISVRCVCMQPFGRPVVPEVYGSTARSSAPALIGPGVRPASSMSAHAQRPGPSSGWRGAATNSGTARSVGRCR